MLLSRGVGFATLAAALFVGSMALGQVSGEDHSAHHPGPQAEETSQQMQSNPQMMGGCPMMGNMMGQDMQGMGPGMMQGMGPGLM